MFERAHHQRVALVLGAINAPLLKAHACLFAGGTVFALKFAEYRESVDLDFLVSDLAHYSNLRQLLRGADGIAAILLPTAHAITQTREIRADQYGIRTTLAVAGQPIKFEIVLEGRVSWSCRVPPIRCAAWLPSRRLTWQRASCWPTRIALPTTARLVGI